MISSLFKSPIHIGSENDMIISLRWFFDGSLHSRRAGIVFRAPIKCNALTKFIQKLVPNIYFFNHIYMCLGPLSLLEGPVWNREVVSIMMTHHYQPSVGPPSHSIRRAGL